MQVAADCKFKRDHTSRGKLVHITAGDFMLVASVAEWISHPKTDEHEDWVTALGV